MRKNIISMSQRELKRLHLIKKALEKEITQEEVARMIGSEKLWELDKIKIHEETLRLWLIEKKIEYQGWKKRRHQQWREKKRVVGRWYDWTVCGMTGLKGAVQRVC